METIGFIGSGNMAEALIKGILSAKVYKGSAIFISDISGERVKELVDKYKVTAAKSNSELAAKAGVIVLSVKPQNIGAVLEEVAEVAADKLVISIAAGITVGNISDVLGDAAIVRVMPNTPALIGEGAAAIYANEKAKGKLAKVEEIFSAVGTAVVVDSEELIDAVTAVSGSGPAYYFLMIEEMIKAAVALGLSEEVAAKLVLQTAKGAGMLATEQCQKGQSAAELRRKVTSPGGTTEAAIGVLVEGGFGRLVSSAIERGATGAVSLACDNSCSDF